MTAVAVYASGHGFGHATRVIETVEALRRRRPDIDLLLRTTAPRELFEHGLSDDFEHTAVRLDVGVVQSDSLTLDLAETLRCCRSISAARPRLVEQEIERLGSRDVRLVLGDIPAFSFEVAARLGVPGVAAANFSWDWIYEEYAEELPGFDAICAELRRAYAKAELLCRLPMACPMPAFGEVVDVPLVARTSRAQPTEVRRRLDLPSGTRLVLLSFGGMGLSFESLPPAPPGVCFVLPHGSRSTEVGPGYVAVANSELRSRGLRYEDLVAAADAVMTKPGYGIVAECAANRTPIVYTSRGRFREYPVLVDYIERNLAAVYLDNRELRAGRWLEAIDAVLQAPWPGPMPRTDGAEVVADVLAGYL